MNLHSIIRVRRVRNLAEPSRVCVGIWNVGSFTGKLREIVDTMIRRRVNILLLARRRNGRGKKQRRWKILASNFGTQEIRQPRMA
jgi:hypothetical protein